MDKQEKLKEQERREMDRHDADDDDSEEEEEQDDNEEEDGCAVFYLDKVFQHGLTITQMKKLRIPWRMDIK